MAVSRYRGTVRLLIPEIPEEDLDMIERAVRNEGFHKDH
jgi:hypothetical protein